MKKSITSFAKLNVNLTNLKIPLKTIVINTVVQNKNDLFVNNAIFKVCPNLLSQNSFENSVPTPTYISAAAPTRSFPTIFKAVLTTLKTTFTIKPIALKSFPKISVTKKENTFFIPDTTELKAEVTPEIIVPIFFCIKFLVFVKKPEILFETQVILPSIKIVNFKIFSLILSNFSLKKILTSVYLSLISLPIIVKKFLKFICFSKLSIFFKRSIFFMMF